jgi:isopenicillin N synthase-like dioxygenase
MTVPLIDLAAADDAALALRIDAALREAGFFAISGHGVPATLRADVFAASQRFFGQSEVEKAGVHIDLSPGKRGFDPVGWQALDVGQPPDLKESFYLGSEHLGLNQWPDEAALPGFRAACEAWSAAMQALSRRLMGLFAQALTLPPGYFDAYMTDPTCTTRLLHYPPQEPPQDPPQPATAPGQIGCGAHTDWGALTLLAQDEAGGLQVQRPDGSWIDIAPTPGALIVNTGDMMQRWTNDRWRSTMHRVVNRGRERWSIAYFCDLDSAARIEPLPVCVSAAHPARYTPVTAGEHLAEMYRRTTVAA